MPSLSLQHWRTARSRELDQLEAAHRRLGGVGRGRRYAIEQINHAYAVLLASWFQGFCRDLHSACAELLVRAISPVAMQAVVRREFLLDRTLDRGNATPGSIGSDFNRLGVEFWTFVYADRPRNDRRREILEGLNRWRNAIAHQDFDPAVLGGTATLHLPRVRNWRRACGRLAESFDRVMHGHILQLTGTAPW